MLQKKEVKHRIVSIDRPYIRPIVRGKENKRVEFGAKVNNIQIDGISFIEHHSFEAFNEGVRLQECIEYQQELTGVKVAKVGADTIYANNDNRRYCTENGITTCFVRKGPKPKNEDADISTARRMIGTLRSTAMEGSFGNQKQHYGVGRIAARNSRSETLLLFSASTWQTPQRLPPGNSPQKKRRSYAKSDEHENSGYFSTSEALRRRIVVSVPLRNALFHALRTENLPPQSKRHSNRTDTIHFKLE